MMTTLRHAVIGCAVSWLALAGLARADAPPLVPVQGYLTDDDGNAVNDKHRLTFIVYNDDRAGDSLYTDDYPSVDIADGRFVIYLGGQDDNPLDLGLFAGSGELWLEIVVDGTDVINPRMRLGSVPYAGFAAYCGAIEGSTLADLDAKYVPQSSLSVAAAETLTGGGNADALHTHAAAPVGWSQCGTISQIAECQLPNFPSDDYEYGFKYNGPVVQRANCTTWNVGMHLYNADPYLMDNDNPSVSLRMGGVMFYTGTYATDDDQPDQCPAGAWRQRYWYLSPTTEPGVTPMTSNGCLGADFAIYCRLRT
jgi:hypothetical protein